MRILIDIGHPAHVHLFKHFAWEMSKNGHSIFMTARQKEVSVELLNEYNFSHKSFGKTYKGIIGKIWGIFRFTAIMYKYAHKVKPDVFMSHSSIYAALGSWMMRKPHFAIEDTGNMEQVGIAKLCGAIFLTSTSFSKRLNKKQVFYKGYHELAYLHPNRFKKDSNTEDIILVRFVSWDSSHDVAEHGLSYQQKVKLVKRLEQYGKIVISTEKPLNGELSTYVYTQSADLLHGLITKSKLVIGESATLSSEAAMLGVPAIYLDNKGRFYTTELEKKYQLVHNFKFKDFDIALQTAEDILKDPDSYNNYKQRKDAMLKEKIDVTAFFVWFIENYPGSHQIMLKNPEYQDRFLTDFSEQ